MHASIDIGSYFDRIGYGGDSAPTLAVLEALHEAHVGAIPFENLDVLLKRPVALDLDALWAKMVTGGRGGYCFEQSLLFQAVLHHLGFSVQALAARVRMGRSGIAPRTHMLLLVQIGGERFLADVGFGGLGLLMPMLLVAGQERRLPLVSFRLDRKGSLWVLRAKSGDLWTELYAFTLEPHYPVDFDVANHYTATHPQSRFVNTLTAQRVRRFERTVLRNRELEILTAEGAERRTLGTPEEMAGVLAEHFGLYLSPGAELPSALFG